MSMMGGIDRATALKSNEFRGRCLYYMSAVNEFQSYRTTNYLYSLANIHRISVSLYLCYTVLLSSRDHSSRFDLL